MTKNIIKYSLGAVGIVFIGLISLYFLRTWLPEYRTMKEVERLKKEYAEDPYGGYTPEETMKLFIEALKKGDIELASRYFVLDKQGQRHRDLVKAVQENRLAQVVKDLEQFKLVKKDESRAFFDFLTDKNFVESEIIVERQSINGRWKITNL